MTTSAADGSDPAPQFRVPVARIVLFTPVAMIVGIACALLLWGISAAAGALEHVIWDDLTRALGITMDTWWWILSTLTITGFLVGLVVRYSPGHAGPDPATTELVSDPVAPKVVPGVAVAAILGLAGGVSLGPESPIMAINAALVVALGARLIPAVGANEWLGLSTSATIGALFGTPVAAALMLSEIHAGDQRIPLWNRLYLPLVAAATASFVIDQFTDLDMSIGLPAEKVGGILDTLIAIAVAVVVAAVGVLAASVFNPLHTLLHKIRNPIVLLTLAGFVLGLLGILGGTITLFKGLDQMKELPDRLATTTALGFCALAGIKLVALLVASASGFRGGRIFPAVFVGAALGFGVHQIAPDHLPLTITVAAGVAGIVVAATRSGWMSLFIALAVVPQLQLLVPLLFATLAAWLVVANSAELRARAPATDGESGT